jgi:mono/diheme cytochrome c family protein
MRQHERAAVRRAAIKPTASRRKRHGVAHAAGRVALALLALLVGLGIALAAALWWLNVRGERDADAAVSSAGDAPLVGTTVDAQQVARGAYLARAGNCQGCHTPRGAAPYSGGRGIATPFGTVYSPNLTPDLRSGIGAWTAADFRRALHNGRSRDGRLLYPAFPYDSYTRISTGDADALFAYLRSLPAVERANRPHALRFPYGTQAALAVWRALFFRPGRFEPDAAHPAQWNRGAYLVQGLGHCSACHAPRNALGAQREPLTLSGGLMPMQHWLAPALAGAPAAPVASLLQRGVAVDAALLGPMAEVVLHSTQHLAAADLQAMALYLESLPLPAPARADSADAAPAPAQWQRGEKIYAERCARCHGDDGRGRQRAYVPLAGNRALLRDPPANPVQVVLGGAFAASTALNPQPFGMPPFANELSDEDVAAVLSYARNAWGNRAGAVRALDVQRWRGSVRP